MTPEQLGWMTLHNADPTKREEKIYVRLDRCWAIFPLDDEAGSRILSGDVSAVAVPNLKPGGPPMLPQTAYAYLDVSEVPSDIFALLAKMRN